VRFVEDGCAPVEVIGEGRVPPQRNNIYVALRPS